MITKEANDYHIKRRRKEIKKDELERKKETIKTS